MAKIRWLLATLLALILLSASGITPASAANAAQARDLIARGGTAVVPPTVGVLGGSGGSGSGDTDGDPDDIIEGNRVVALVNSCATPIGAPAGAAALLCFKVGGVILLVRRLVP